MRAARSAPARDLVTLGQGQDAVTLRWKGGLPEPVLSGAQATYPNAVPGADVVVEATRTGFEQFVVIKERPTSTDWSYTLPLVVRGVKARKSADGGVEFVDRRTGKVRAVMPAPVMWDSSATRGTAQAEPAGQAEPTGQGGPTGQPARQVPASMEVSQKGSSIELTVKPDAQFLADPDTVYPVTVDPSTTGLWMVSDTFIKPNDTSGRTGATSLEWGTNPAGVTMKAAQTFMTWYTEPVADALVSNATLSMWNYNSGNTADCKSKGWSVYPADKTAWSSTRWADRPVPVEGSYATSYQTKGGAGCAADGWITADLTELVQVWASAKNTNSPMLIKAGAESDPTYFKQVNSSDAATNVPKLTVTYNYRPRTGTAQEAGPPFVKDSNGYWMVNTLRPVLRDTFTDVNGDRVRGNFQVFASATGNEVGVFTSAWATSGTPSAVTIPAGKLTDGALYRFRTSPYDGSHYNDGWSPWGVFRVDVSPPDAPASVTSTAYPTGAWSGKAGKAGVFTIKPPANEHTRIEWSWDQVTWNRAATTGTAPVNVTAAPPKAGVNSLWVRTVDKAENTSDTVEYRFTVGAGAVSRPDDGVRTAARVPLAAQGDSSRCDKVSFSWRRGEAGTWTQIPAGDVTRGGQPVTWPVALKNGASEDLVWNATKTVDPDGAVQVRADFTGPNGAAVSGEPIDVVVDRTADGAGSEEVGPGSVNLLTGDYTLSETDASFFSMTVTRSASSRTPEAGSSLEGQAPIFGPQWQAGTVAEATESEYVQVRRTSATSVDVDLPEGDTIAFTANAARTGWVAEPGAADLTLTGSLSGDEFTLRDTEGTVTTFTKVAAGATTWTASSSLSDGLENSTTKVVSEAVTVDGKTLTRPKRIIAATSATTVGGCQADPSTAGCRVLDFVYAASTTASAQALGDYAGRVKELRLWATDPGADKATATAVAAYAYDAAGRLREQWDPRITPALKTAYTYDDAGRVTAVKPAGELPWTFAYGRVGSNPAAGDGMLLRVSRASLKPGTRDEVNGTATTTLVYGVPVTGTGAPHDLGAASVARWGQKDMATDATAVFDANHVPSSSDAAELGSGSYGAAEVHYLDASAAQVNEVSPGGFVTTTEYDRFGNTVRSLSASNRALALGSDAKAVAELTGLGINALPSAERAWLLSEVSVFDADGQRELESLGPLHEVTLSQDVSVDGAMVAGAGSRWAGRSRSVKEYDAGRPTNGTATVKDQVTKSTDTAVLWVWPDAVVESRVASTGYDWVKGLATSQTTDPGGLGITSRTAYDEQGRVVSSSQPKSNGTDAGTTITEYWTGTGTGPCGGHPEWADAVCRVRPAGAVTGGGDNPSQLVTTSTRYDRWGSPAVQTETANGVTRTTTTTFDGAGRAVSVAVTGDSALGQAVPAVTTSYDPATGRAVGQSSSTGGTVAHAFDVLGREYSYTDADGATTTTSLDVLDRPVRVSDAVPSSVSYEYDEAVEPRGLVTKVTDSVAGAFTARYDADGDVAVEGLPGGYSVSEVQDPAGETLSRVYTRDGDGAVVLSDTVGVSVHGQVVSHTGTPGVTSSQEYGYDAAGRLTGVADTSARAVCTRRSYGFDKNSNRTSLTTATGVTGGDCPATGGTTVSSVFDTADRLIADGQVYDAFGRATQVPGSTLAYHVNDLARSQTAGSRRQMWDLDVAGRYRSWTVESNTTGEWAQTSSKTNHYDGDSDSPRWVVENTSTGLVTRNVEGPGGDLAATTTATGGTVLYLSTIHGDTPVQLPLDDPDQATVVETDEYGNVTTGTPARYAWLGAKQRSAETLTGLVLMGVRLYHPETGRFLSTDPVPGGNPNTYTYPVDPINTYDLDGRWGIRSFFKAAAFVGAIVAGAACGASIVCGVSVGAVSGVLSYSASNAFSRRWRWRGAGRSAIIGGFFGGSYGRIGRYFGHAGKRARYLGVTFNKRATARGTDFYWRGVRHFGIHSHRIPGAARWKLAHYHRRPGIKHHRPWQRGW